MSSTSFDAFISYRRSDGTVVARWLRRELETYRLPRAMRKPSDRPLKIYLDTAYERGTLDFYEQTIRPALLSARWLIVIATPDAVARPPGVEDWIQREVSDFSAGPNAQNIIAVRAKGGFTDPLPAVLTKHYPRIEIVDLRGASRFSFLNPLRQARLSSEKLKIIAPLLDIPVADMPRLRQEEELRQQTRLGVVTGVTLGVLTMVSLLLISAIRSRNETARALEDSMFAFGSMVSQSVRLPEDKSQGLESSRSRLIYQGCDLLDKLSFSLGREPHIAEQVTCAVERSKAHELLGELAVARAGLTDAITNAAARYKATNRPEFGISLLEARSALADHLLRQNLSTEAEGELTKLQQEARKLQTEHESYVGFIRSEADAFARRGDLLANREDFAKSASDYEAAADAVTRMQKILAQGEDPSQLVWAARLYTLAGSNSLRVKELDHVRSSLGKAFTALKKISVKDIDGDLPRMDAEDYAFLAHAYADFFVEARQQNNLSLAGPARETSLQLCDEIIASKSATTEVRTQAQELKAALTSQELN